MGLLDLRLPSNLSLSPTLSEGMTEIYRQMQRNPYFDGSKVARTVAYADSRQLM